MINFIRWTGWALLMVLPVAAIAYSMHVAFEFAAMASSTPDDAHFSGAALAATEAAKAVAIGFGYVFWRNGARLSSLVAFGLFILMMAMSAFTTASLNISNRAVGTATIHAASKQEGDLRDELRANEARLSQLGRLPSLASAEADARVYTTDDRWRATISCTASGLSGATERFCSRAIKAERVRADAEEAERLRNRASEIRGRLIELAPESTKAVAPDLAYFAKRLSWQPEDVALARALALAVILELVGGLLGAWIWDARPASPSPPAASEAVTGASCKSGTAPAVPTDPAVPPKAPTPPRCRKRKPQSAPVSGRPGRPRNSNVLNFIQAFTAKHGRPPTMGEAQMELGKFQKRLSIGCVRRSI